LNLEDRNNFKSDTSVQQWEGEDPRPGVCHLRFCVAFITLVVDSEKSSQLQFAATIQTGEKVQLLCGQLFQRYSVPVCPRLTRGRNYPGRQSKFLC
jgi:hypothetical protein